MGVLPGGVQFARKADHHRFSSGGASGVGAGGTPGTSKDPSVASTAEGLLGGGGSGWNEGGDEGEGAAEEDDDGPQESGEEEKAVGPFSDTCLEMARLRLPHMELGFEEDGFFGIDVRSLIIGREIARGAYGVVHEGKLVLPRPKDGAEDGGGDGEQSGAAC